MVLSKPFEMLETDALGRMKSYFMVFSAEGNNILLFASENFFAISGYTSQEVVGRTPQFLQNLGEEDYGTRMLQELLDSKEDGTVKARNFTKSGLVYESEITITHICVDDNTPIAILAVIKIT